MPASWGERKTAGLSLLWPVEYLACGARKGPGLLERVTLKGVDKIGEGHGRRVYPYPGHPEWIIKLHKPFREKRFRTLRRNLRYMGRRFGKYRHSIFEAEEYTSMVARLDEIPDFAPGYRGLVETDEGIGAVFDAVRDPDGSISPTLRGYLEANGCLPEIEAAIDAFWAKVKRFRVVVSDPQLPNILVRSDDAGGIALWIVDGLGEQTFIPIMRLSDRVYQRNMDFWHQEMLKRARGYAAG